MHAQIDIAARGRARGKFEIRKTPAFKTGKELPTSLISLKQFAQTPSCNLEQKVIMGVYGKAFVKQWCTCSGGR